nr:hypothetical protein [Candidatus Enterousia merdequi]
ILPMIMISIDGFGMIVRHYNAGEERPGTCNINVLGVSEDNSTSDMDAGFRPNVMTISWQTSHIGGDKTINSYDSKVKKPESEPGKIGYKFVGWKVSGVKTCADFSSGENLCKKHQNCIWKDSTCIVNPCVMCAFSRFSDELICRYQEYNYETNSCASLLQ